ncbi:MAG: hypothetical protein WCD86_17065 [Ktedonobacteraceae bacterium]
MTSSQRRNFEEEREEGRQVAERLTAALHALHLEVGPIDWERAGMLASVPVNGVNVGDLITVGGSAERGKLLEQVRLELLEAAARTSLQLHGSGAISWTPLSLPQDAPGEMHSLWRIHLDEEHPGVNVAEYLREGKRTYEYYPGGPQFGCHAFYVDTITPAAIQAIRQAPYGSVVYEPKAMRADGVRGRRWVTLPEGTRQAGNNAFMAPQTFTFPDGTQLRLIPHDYTVELYIVGEK